MNREILFRGKRVDNKEWIYGLLLTAHSNSFFIECKDSAFYEEVIPETVGIKAVCNFHYYSTVDVDSFFEGDILDNEYTITYNEENAGLYLKSKYGLGYDKKISAIYEERMKLTGNIHDKE